MKTTGVIIARFQTPYLHDGHNYLLNEIQSKHNKIVIVLGVSPLKSSKRNPFDFYTREKMLKQYRADLVILPLRDQASDTVWSHHLDDLLQNTFPNESFVLYGSRDSFIPAYSGKFPTEALAAQEGFSATDIRDANADKVLDTTDFRFGVNYACQNGYAKVYPTVDVAVLKDNRTQVLLGKKHFADQWRFPGGFADPTDDNYEAAAKREMTEECGDIETGEMQYVGSASIDDWRYRQEVDKILTLLFKTDLVYGEPKAADDLADLAWFPVQQLPTMMQNNSIVKEHHVLMSLLLKNL
ncbi:MAG: NUDIX domain-containing protein [Chitinophagaceae bacterium]